MPQTRVKTFVIKKNSCHIPINSFKYTLPILSLLGLLQAFLHYSIGREFDSEFYILKADA